MLRLVLICCTLQLWVLQVAGKTHSSEGCPKSKTLYLKNETDVLEFECQNESPENSLSVTIEDKTNSTDGISIEICSYFVKTSSSLTITDGNVTNPTTLYEGNPVNGKNDIWLPTGRKRIQINFKGGKQNTIKLRVMSKCEGVARTPVFYSPILLTTPLKKIVRCSFRFNGPASLTFTRFKLSNGSEATFISEVPNSLSGPFKGPTEGPDHIIIVNSDTVFNLTLNLFSVDQSIEFHTMPLQNQACHDQSMFIVDKSMFIQYNRTKLEVPESCLWLAAAPEGQKLALFINNNELHGGGDIISVMDSGNFSGSPLTQITDANKEISPLTSTGRYLLIYFSSFTSKTTESFAFEVRPIMAGGRMLDNGTMILKNDCNYTLTTSERKTLVVRFSDVTNLNASQTIEVFAGSATVPFETFNSDQVPYDISSPGSELRVVATGFKGVSVKIRFSSVPKDSGCSRFFVAPTAENVRLIGSCDGQCSWFVKPEVPDNQNLTFVKIFPNNVPSGTITHFKGTEGTIELRNSADPFVITYKTSAGIRMEFDCSNAKDFEMSYSTQSSSDRLIVNAAAKANITLTSPLFPAIYPQGIEMGYNISVADMESSYLASFHVFDLLPKHSLTFGRKDRILQLTGPGLPGDMLIEPRDLVDAIMTTTPVSSRINPKGGHGFRISLIPATSSGTMTETKKTFSTGEKCASLRCVYIINLPLPSDVSASVAVNLTVTLPENKTSLNDSDLLVWDGDSVLRSPLLAPIANLTKGGVFSSRSNKLIIVYKGASNIVLSYVQSSCSFENNTMCKRDRLCMPLSWRCDNHLGCSDGSDELGCKNGLPPTPMPSPPQASSSSWKIAFWVLMPVFILLGFALDRAVPAVLLKVRNLRYQQFHDLGDH